MSPSIAGLPFKPVDRSVADHPIERRGFLTVPLDWTVPAGAQIELFWRLIPAYGGTPDDPSKPIVVVINGGPGIPASFYRPLDYDYAQRKNPKGGLDRFLHLLETHRVLIADQRGTDGASAPLDVDDPTIDPDLVAKHFSSDSHALDYLALVDHLVPAGERFFVIAQSYGGLPGMQLVAQRDRRQPTGIVFSSSAPLPFEDSLAQMRSRRGEQLKLNQQLRAAVPDIAERLERARAHVTSLGLDPVIVQGLWALLGKDVPGVWEQEVVKRLERMMGQTRAEVLQDVEDGLEAPSLLNYILSSSNFSPGWTDRTLAALGSREIPFEPWMLDEHEMLMQTRKDVAWRAALVDRIDAHPPAGTPFPTLEALRAALAESQALFTVADNDAMVPGDLYRETVARFLVPGHGAVVSLPGGHSAIFLERGHAAFVAWSSTL